MKPIANYISASRIFLALSLALVKPLSTSFFVIYLVCGFSDMIDGYIARKTGTVSKLGEKLDSAADLIMVTILLVVLYPFIHLSVQIFVWIVMIGIIRAVSMIVVFLRYKTFCILHTYGNKMTGLVLFAFPVFLALVQSDLFMYFICSVASISAIEEFIIHLSSKDLRTSRKSIFTK